MRAHEILNEVVKTVRFKYGKYLLVHTDVPNDKNLYIGRAFHDTVMGSTKIAELEHADLDELKKEFIDLANADQRSKLKKNLAKKERISASDVERAAIDLNTAFTSKIFEYSVPTAIRFKTDGGKLVIDVMTKENFDMGGVQADKSFKTVKDRAWNPKAKTKIYGLTNVNPNKLEQMGFEFHGVYDLSDMESPDPDEYKRYALDLIGYSDKSTSYPFPTITIAYWDKKNGDQSGGV